MCESGESEPSSRMSHSTLNLFKACWAAPLLLLGACENSGHMEASKNLPVINLHGSTRTPAHGMSHADYPFADNGDYKSDWAAEEGGAGMTAIPPGVRPMDLPPGYPPRKKTSSKSKQEEPLLHHQKR